jgi:hypothetical protein
MGRDTTRTSIAAAVLAVTTLGACAGDDDGDADEARAADSATAAEQLAATSAPAAEASGGDGGGGVNAAPIDIGVIGRDVIIEMYVVLGSNDIERSVASISANASGLGGGIASSDIDYESGDDGERTGHAVLVVKVPPEAVDRLLEGLEATGTVQSIDQSAQDVTEQLVDLDVRIANARQSVTNVRTFMEQTQNLSELVTLESELTRRQTELEQLEAQQRNLADRVALSTVTVEIVPTGTSPAGEDEGIGDAFRRGWDAFATFFFVLAFVLAVLAPFAAVGAVVAAVLWRLSRRPTRMPRLRTHGTAGSRATGDEPVSEEEPVSASRPG